MKENDELNEIKNLLTIEQIESLLLSLDGDPQRQNDNVIVARTICHCGNSHKLYYYHNSKLFRCYTECSSTFDVFELIRKIQTQKGKDLGLPHAILYIKNFFNLTGFEQNFFFNNENELEDWQILKRYNNNKELKENNRQIVELKHFDKKILKYLPRPRILNWEAEGITKEVIKSHNICYNPSSQAIVIPHYDENDNLIGIRERTLIKENEEFGKYKPAILNNQMYNHPLGFSLYNLNNSKDNIKKMKRAIVFEGEKSDLLFNSYFGDDADISVAVCGSSLSNYQVKLLLDLGINELIIAFDKQFQQLGDDEHKNWVKKLKQINNKYNSIVQVSFIFDKWNLLGYKDSPIDRGKDIFLELFKKRIML